MEVFLTVIQIILLVFLSLLLFGFILSLASDIISFIYGSIFSPIPKRVIKKSLKLVDSKKDLIIDLGSGDGRVLRSAIKDFGFVLGIGYEVNYWLILKSKILNKIAGLDKKIKIIRKDFFKGDISKADLIFLYLYPAVLPRLEKKLVSDLQKGIFVVSCRFPIYNKEGMDKGLRLIKSEIEEKSKIKIFVYQK